MSRKYIVNLAAAMKLPALSSSRSAYFKLVPTLMLALASASAQTVAFTEKFETSQGDAYTTSGVIGASVWTVTRSTAGDWGARIHNAQLELTNDAGATGNANGWVLASTPTTSFGLPYNSTLSSNPGAVTWEFNMRQIRPDPAGFSAGSYGVAFVLAGSSANAATEGSGYAVVLGQSGATDPVRLVAYVNGLQGTLTTIITATAPLADVGVGYMSLRVQYGPGSNIWELYGRSDGETAFSDPALGDLTLLGSGTNGTHTATSLGFLGGYWQGSTAATQTAFFDNIRVLVLEPVPVSQLFWDANGNTAGAGGATPAGTWGVDAFWSSDLNGETATGAWVPAQRAVFAAGTDATGEYTVTLSGAQDVNGIHFEEGHAQLSGGALLLGSSTPFVIVDAPQATIASDITGTNGLIKNGAGALNLAGVKTFSGSVVINAGVARIAEDGALGAATNDVGLFGTLATTQSLTLGAGRDFTGGGTLAPAAGTTAELAGGVTMTGLTLADTGTVNLTGVTRSVGALGFTAAGTLTGSGVITASGLSAAALTSGTATVSAPLDFTPAGTTNMTVNVGAGAQLTLGGALTKLSSGSAGRLSKQGAGTLRLEGANVDLCGVQLGVVGASPVVGGTLVITNKDALGTRDTDTVAAGAQYFQAQLNSGTLQIAGTLTGGNAVPNGISIGARAASPLVFTGGDVEFLGASSLFGATGTGDDIVVEVNNHVTLPGAFTQGGTGPITGLALSGTGTLTFANAATLLTSPLKLGGTVTVELDTATLGATTAAAPVHSLAAGTTLVIGKPGETRLVTAFGGLDGAAGSKIAFDLDGLARGDDYDALVLAKPDGAAGAVVFAGTIEVELVGAFEPEIGDTFDLLDWDASVTPDFTGIAFDLPPLPMGREWNTNSFAANGSISVQAESNVDFTITTQPQSQTKLVGQPVTFTVIITGTGPFSYQWRKGAVNQGGPTSDNFLTIGAVSPADAGTYFVDITNASGTLGSAGAVLTVITPVQITQQPAPASQTVIEGATVQITAAATGTGPLSYNWRKGTDSLGAPNDPVLTLNNVQIADSGDYNVIVTGPGMDNFEVSQNASLTVNPAPPPGPISITGNMTYSENFDGMGTTTPGTEFPNGWKGFKFAGTGGMAPGTELTNLTTPAFTASNGGGTAGTLYNYGVEGANPLADRALGSQASGGFIGAFGVSFINDTGGPLEGVNIKIGFRSELWRTGNNAGEERWIFEWKLGGGITDLDLGEWNTASAFDIVEIDPTNTTNSSRDGNAGGNFATLSPAFFSSLSGWEPGQVLHIRWRDVDNTGNDAGMAIDDFTFTAENVPPPPTLLYWDANGALAGAGGPTPTGTWGVDTFWGGIADGTGATAAWQAGGDAIFSAGADATGMFTVTVAGTQDLGALVFEEGQVTLSGGTLNFTDITPKVEVLDTGSASISSLLTGATGLLKRGGGILSLTNPANSFTGNVVLGGGILAVTDDAQLGNADNDIVLSGGSLLTSVSLSFNAQRSISGSGGLAPDAGTTLTLPGPVATSALSVTGTGTLDFTGASPTLGSLSFQGAAASTGVQLALSSIGANHSSGTSIVSNDLNFGTTNATAEVATGGTLQLDGQLSLGGGGSNRLIKTGGGILIISGAQPGLNKLGIGIQQASPIEGGVVVINDKEGAGATQSFFNYGTLQAAVPLTGDEAIAIGLSIGGRDASPSVLAGEEMTFLGDSTLFAATGTMGDIRLNVNNHTTLTGLLTGSLNAGLSGFAIGGDGRLTLISVLSNLTTGIKLKDTVTVELAPTSSLGTAGITSAPMVGIDAGATLAVGLIGTVQEVIAYAGLQGAAGSVLRFDIGGAARGTAYDALRLLKLDNDQAGAVIFAGQVKADLISGFAPALGQSFDLLDWDAGVTPDFTGISFDLPPLGAGLGWNTSYFAVDGTIRVVTDVLTILEEPDSASVSPGQAVSFSVVASGPGIISYQWQKLVGMDFENVVTNGNEATLLLLNPTTDDAGVYRCLVSNGGAPIESAQATLIVFPPLTDVMATRTPAANSYFIIGDSVTFNVTFNNPGGGTVTYQWYRGSSPIGGATGPSFQINPLSLASTGTYSVRVSTGGPPISSNGVPIVVVSPEPAIATQPAPRTLVAVGQPLTLFVEGTGRPPLRYQWKRDGKVIPGATKASLVLPKAALVHAGTYICEVTNAAGPLVPSSTAQVGVVTVNASPPKLNLPEKGKSVMKVLAAGPNLLFNWTRDGGAVPANFISTPDGKTLNGSNLTINDHGSYACTVTLGVLTLQGGQHLLQVYDSEPESPATTTMPDGIIGGNYIFDMPYTVGDPPTEAPDSFSAKGLPAGLKMDPKTGRISGRPTKAVASVPVEMTAKNKLGSTKTTSTLTIHAFPAKLAGPFTALVERDPDLYGNLGGRLDMTITTLGAYSGSLLMGTTKFAIKGVLDLDALDPNGLDPDEGVPPGFEIVIPQKNSPAPLILELDMPLLDEDGDPDINGERFVTGTVTDGTGTADIDGWWQKWNPKAGAAASDFQGYYTFGLAIPENDTALGDASVPQGAGYASFTLAADGKYKLAGKTPDGESLTTAGISGPAGQILVFQTFYKPAAGSLLGVPVISTTGGATPQDRPLMGDADWLRPENTNLKHRVFRAGFALQPMSIMGGRYSLPDAGNVVMNLAPDSQVTMSFLEGGIGTTFDGPPGQTSRVDMTLRIDAKNKLITVAGPALPDTNKPKPIAPKTGLFGGSIGLQDGNPVPNGKPNPVKRTAAYQGILIRDGAEYIGVGYFLLPNLPTDAVNPPTTPTTSPIESGMVLIEP